MKPEGHSPLGASGTHRWLVCPGSVSLSQGIADEESDHAILGTAAHAVGAACLESGEDAWEWIGSFYGDPDQPESGIPVDKDMADAVQVYLDAVRKAHPDRNQGNFFVERDFHCPSIHKLFYGTTDLAALTLAMRRLDVWDYKHGVGVVVEVKDNPQCKYYAAGALTELDLWDKVDTVVLHIAQPRGFHYDGPIREWSISTAALKAWLRDELVPAMDRALVSRDTASGEHCRFCPARFRACPQLAKDTEELEALMKTPAEELTNEQVARLLDLAEVVKIATSAASKTAFARLQAGKTIPGWKLAKKRADRVWKDDAEAAAKAKFGGDAYTQPALKSPAQIEKLPEGAGFAAQHAYKPDTGLTVVRGEDARPAVSKETKSMFEAATKARGK